MHQNSEGGVARDAGGIWSIRGRRLRTALRQTTSAGSTSSLTFNYVVVYVYERMPWRQHARFPHLTGIARDLNWTRSHNTIWICWLFFWQLTPLVAFWIRLRSGPDLTCASVELQWSHHLSAKRSDASYVWNRSLMCVCRRWKHASSLSFDDFYCWVD